jgi:hypothetical protein
MNPLPPKSARHPSLAIFLRANEPTMAGRVLNLSIIHAEPSDTTYRGPRVRFRLTAEESARLLAATRMDLASRAEQWEARPGW